MRVDDFMGETCVVEEGVEGVTFKPLYGAERNGAFKIGQYTFNKKETWYVGPEDADGNETTIAFSGLNAEDAVADTPITISNTTPYDFAGALADLGFTNVIESDPEDL